MKCSWALARSASALPCHLATNSCGEMDWDIGVMVYQPEDPSKIPVGADGKKVGVFLLHGGSGDYRSIEPVAKLLSTKFGYKVASMTFPGRLYLQDPSRKWPNDTIHADGTVRTPIWKSAVAKRRVRSRSCP